MERLCSQRGQVIVEQAIILPVMVFLILGIVQLAMIQHARICTEYAAFNAARAGIVYNGDPDMMERAAFLSLMPTYGRSDNWSAVGKTLLKAAATQFGADLADMLGVDILSDVHMVQVRILDHPDSSIGDRMAILQRQRHLNRQQIDFDDWRRDEALANQLTVQVRYYYEMRIPFANWMVQMMWLMSRTDTLSAYDGLLFVAPTVPFTKTSSHTVTLGKAVASGDEQVKTVLKYRLLGQYRIPINTHYTMRMQSNLYRVYAESPSSTD